MSSMRGIVQALDTVYLWGLRHRVFEAALLYARIGPSFLNYYIKDADQFSSYFPIPEHTGPELQASLALSLAFIIKYRHAELSYGDIYNALGTSVLDKEAYYQFVSVLETGSPIPHVLSLPEQASQPALAERARGSQVEADLPNELQLDDIFALPESFTPPFQTFSTSEALQKLIEEARESVNYQHPQEVLSTLLLEV